MVADGQLHVLLPVVVGGGLVGVWIVFLVGGGGMGGVGLL